MWVEKGSSYMTAEYPTKTSATELVPKNIVNVTSDPHIKLCNTTSEVKALSVSTAPTPHPA